MSQLVRFETLVRSFHCLSSCPPECFRDGFQVEPFIKYARQRSSAGVDAALFVLGVWNASTDWSEFGFTHRGSGCFQLAPALANWDVSMRAAFLAWATDPWWC